MRAEKSSKGDFCARVREILGRYGRAEDYVEISLASEYRYNPLHIRALPLWGRSGLLHRGNRRGSTSRRIRETEAEATAFVVCRHGFRGMFVLLCGDLVPSREAGEPKDRVCRRTEGIG